MKSIESNCYTSKFTNSHTTFFQDGETDSNTYVGIFKEEVIYS